VGVFVYLCFRLPDAADVEEFEGDMRAMDELAREQPGYMWAEMGRSMRNQLTYVVASEWEDIDDVREWEHNAVHVEVQRKWLPLLNEPLVHRRFTHWEPPTHVP
jgi:quinol monooxygenase YgiN